MDPGSSIVPCEQCYKTANDVKDLVSGTGCGVESESQIKIEEPLYPIARLRCRSYPIDIRTEIRGHLASTEPKLVAV